MKSLAAFIIAAVLNLSSCRHAAPQPVSYGRDIAPIFALHCNGCHGGSAPSSSFQLSSYRGIRAGGVLGEDIVPGSPDRSMLVKFIGGFRGPDQRMPLNSAPLTPNQIGLIRRWIAEGALADYAATSCSVLRLPAVRIATGHQLQIAASVSRSASLAVLIQDSGHRVLFSEDASVKQPPEAMDAGAPGQLLTWTVNSQSSWPSEFAVELRVRYALEPMEASLIAGDGNKSSFATRTASPSHCWSD